MNSFPRSDDTKTAFFFHRYRHRALTRGLRRHVLHLLGDPLPAPALPALLHGPLLRHVQADDDDDGGGGSSPAGPACP
jgi:hypothetical protein